MFVVCHRNRTDASEVWSDHNRLIHLLEEEQEEMFLCNLSSKSQKCFWLQANQGALTNSTVNSLWRQCASSGLIAKQSRCSSAWLAWLPLGGACICALGERERCLYQGKQRLNLLISPSGCLEGREIQKQ